ncbi:MAG: SDR family NAD(P)-dependent oxidoreductase [Bacteroides sp.]|nr:SDR family NAD(P)-dependent oxidoreductase [Bacillota bacterium]MCM1393417.1 SDR family NAD(P)-dependent oxidoreductase [[Eubacterium] siraeum]MCM1455403.1 SDR family NAD(P)-dependent oxidoreductase [Bacteroides sp.]
MSKTILVTGGSRGIGEAIVREAAGKMNVAFTYLDSEARALSIVRELSAHGVFAVKCDVRDKQSATEAVEAVKKRFGRIDILVNNAGVSCDGLLIDLSYEDWKNCFAVNADGVFNMTKAALPDMLSDMKGSIVNVSSVWGIVGASNEVAYSSAKAAVIGFTKALAKEVAPMGVRVNAVAPGAVDTDMMAAYGKDCIDALCRDSIPLGRLARADEIAKTVLFVAENEYMSGAVVSVDGLLS